MKGLSPTTRRMLRKSVEALKYKEEVNVPLLVKVDEGDYETSNIGSKTGTVTNLSFHWYEGTHFRVRRQTSQRITQRVLGEVYEVKLPNGKPSGLRARTHVPDSVTDTVLEDVETRMTATEVLHLLTDKYGSMPEETITQLETLSREIAEAPKPQQPVQAPIVVEPPRAENEPDGEAEELTKEEIDKEVVGREEFDQFKEEVEAQLQEKSESGEAVEVDTILNDARRITQGLLIESLTPEWKRNMKNGVCPECDKKTTNHSNLRKHFAKEHSVFEE
jgi:hypothetical protein